VPCGRTSILRATLPNPDPGRPANDSAKAEAVLIAGGFLIVLALTYLYSLSQKAGLDLYFSDSWTYTEMAKRVALTHALAMGRVYDVLYPPLYPMILAPAYLAKDARTIFLAIRAINILVYSLVFIPTYGLLKEYARLTRPQSFLGGIIFSISPWTIQYATSVMSEALFIPLVVLVLYLFHKRIFLQSRLKAAGFGAILATLPLTKAIGFVVVFAFGLTALLHYFAEMDRRPARTSPSWMNPVLALSSCFLILLVQKRWMDAMNPGLALGAGSDLSGYLKLCGEPLLRSPSYWLTRVRIDGMWACFSTCTILGAISLVIFARRIKSMLSSDPFAVFVLLSLLGTVLIIPVFTTPEGIIAVHVRYLVPFAFASTLIALRLRGELFDRTTALGVMVLSAFYVLNARYFATQPAFSQSFHHHSILLLRAGFVAGQAAVFLPMTMFWSRFRERFVTAILLLLLAIYPTISFHRTIPGVVQRFDDQTQISTTIISWQQAFPRTKVYIDENWRQNPGWADDERIMTGIPSLYGFTSIDSLRRSGKGPETPWIFLTHQELNGERLLLRAERLNLYSSR